MSKIKINLSKYSDVVAIRFGILAPLIDNDPVENFHNSKKAKDLLSKGAFSSSHEKNGSDYTREHSETNYCVLSINIITNDEEIHTLKVYLSGLDNKEEGSYSLYKNPGFIEYNNSILNLSEEYLNLFLWNMYFGISISSKGQAYRIAMGEETNPVYKIHELRKGRYHILDKKVVYDTIFNLIKDN